jgi:pimeloyl-ACP methyl ester carboxylesterase
MTWIAQARVTVLSVLPILLAGCISFPSTAQQITTKRAASATDGGTLNNAPYRIDLPKHWKGDLVMLLHGYEPKGVPRPTPWPQSEAAPIFLAQGYAVATSAYASQGWAVAEALNDNERLRTYFLTKYGQPRRTYLAGFSLGGHIALASLEQHGKQYDGALSLCGVNVPAAQAFDEGIFTSLVAFDYFFPGIMGLAPGGLADSASPPRMDQEATEKALQKNEAAATILSKRLEIPRSALASALMFNYTILREMQSRAGGHPTDNRTTAYLGFSDDAAFNRGVRRYAGDAGAIEYVANHAKLTGRIDKPVVLFSNITDPTVPKRFTESYPALVKAANKADQLAILQPVGEGHCNFTPKQIANAFSTLTHWVGHGKRSAPAQSLNK